MENKFRAYLKKKEKIIGFIASALAVVMFITLIEILISNLRGESNIYIQPAATAFNGFFWSLYAYGRKDLFLLVPNLLALALGLITALAAFVS